MREGACGVELKRKSGESMEDGFPRSYIIKRVFQKWVGRMDGVASILD